MADNDRWSSGIGTSTNTCSDVYKGAAAESAPEIRITTDYYRALRPINGAIDFHSYGQVGSKHPVPPMHDSSALIRLAPRSRTHSFCVLLLAPGWSSAGANALCVPRQRVGAMTVYWRDATEPLALRATHRGTDIPPPHTQTPHTHTHTHTHMHTHTHAHRIYGMKECTACRLVHLSCKRRFLDACAAASPTPMTRPPGPRVSHVRMSHARLRSVRGSCLLSSCSGRSGSRRTAHRTRARTTT